MKFSLFSAVLFSIGWMSVVASGDGRAPSCCLKVTNTRVHVENIVKYEMQDSPLCIRVVRFYTKMSKVICSDPDSKYAKRIMDILDGRTTAKPIMCYTSTTNTIPTVTTTNKTPGMQTETSTRISTTASRIVTTIETSTPETETSTSTTASRIVTTIETSTPETEVTKTTNQPTSVSKENPESSLSTMTTCGTGGQTSPSTETRRRTPGIGTITNLNTLKKTDNTTSRVINTTLTRRTKLSKLSRPIKKRKRGKGESKTKLRRFQMGIRNKHE